MCYLTIPRVSIAYEPLIMRRHSIHWDVERFIQEFKVGHLMTDMNSVVIGRVLPPEISLQEITKGCLHT